MLESAQRLVQTAASAATGRPLIFDAHASLPHYARHFLPLWNALAPEERGDFYGPRLTKRAFGDACTLGLPTSHGPPVIVAAASDLHDVHPDRPVVFVEHGAGQRYNGAGGPIADHAGYSGGRGREQVALFVCPNEDVAAANRAAYPDTPAVGTGSLRLEELVGTVTRHVRGACPVIGVAFHFDLRMCPESRWAFPAHRSAIADLARTPAWEVVGTAHPKAFHQLRPFYARAGIPTVTDEAEFLSSIDVLVVDNSTIGFMAAALGIPTVWLNAPWYRRDVNHGLRFWDLIPGPQVDAPTQLPAAVVSALAGTWAACSDAVAERVFPAATRNGAADRAAGALRAHLG